jgi:hypothetical protein
MENHINYTPAGSTQSDKGPSEIYKRFKELLGGVTIRPDLFVLGADDPEMAEIEGLLMVHGKRFEYATCDGKRVHPGNAYMADPVVMRKGSTVVLVECGPTNLANQIEIRVITLDHHRFGDFGFSLGPARFWEASSIGQLYKLLELGKPTHEHLVLAAMDHCMVQARLGNCPGVDPEEVRALGRKYTAKRNNVELSWLEECIRVMRTQIIASPTITIGTQDVVDFTGMSIGMVYSLEYLCMQEALADLGLVAVFVTKNKAGEPDKVAICGAATTETIESFKNAWAPEQGLIDIYGVPERGHAGGYRK